ncbi:MAG: winged helix-turn-helix domain-containing protein [Opitutaceae bacterium]|nr:winged helix-turn-helix domain-containing protein [Opitutaceae bacterium]
MSPFQRVLSLLRSLIHSGEYAPGDLIPTGRDIARLCHDVSESTVRRAIKTLAAEGLLHSVRGKGVFVRIPRSAKT